MHEVSIVQGLCVQLDALAREHRAHRIHRIEVEIGALSNVVPELFRDAFEVVRASVELIAGAELVVHEVPLVVACADCEQEFELAETVFLCPGCQSTRLDVRQGEELLLRQVELEKEEEEE